MGRGFPWTGRVDSGDGSYWVPLPVGHVNHSVPQLPVVSIVLPDLIHLRSQASDDFAVGVVVPYEITGGDVGAVANARDGALSDDMPLSAAFPTGSSFDGKWRGGSDVVEFYGGGDGGRGERGEWGPDALRGVSPVDPVLGGCDRGRCAHEA